MMKDPAIRWLIFMVICGLLLYIMVLLLIFKVIS